MEQNTLNKEIKNTLNKWRESIDELELQLSLGKSEALEEFEKRKTALNHSVNELKAKAVEWENLGEAKTQDFRAKLDELQVQLALGKAETEDIFNEQRKKIEHAIYESAISFKEIRDQAGVHVVNFIDDFDQSLNEFKSKLETFKLHYSLGKAEVKDELEKSRVELKSNLNELKQKFDEAGKVNEAKWDDFKSEMQTSFTHAKKAFEGFLK